MVFAQSICIGTHIQTHTQVKGPKGTDSALGPLPIKLVWSSTLKSIPERLYLSECCPGTLTVQRHKADESRGLYRLSGRKYKCLPCSKAFMCRFRLVSRAKTTTCVTSAWESLLASKGCRVAEVGLRNQDVLRNVDQRVKVFFGWRRKSSKLVGMPCFNSLKTFDKLMLYVWCFMVCDKCGQHP